MLKTVERLTFLFRLRRRQVGSGSSDCRLSLEWLKHVNDALVYTHFKLLTTLFVDMRAFDNSKDCLLGW